MKALALISCWISPQVSFNKKLDICKNKSLYRGKRACTTPQLNYLVHSKLAFDHSIIKSVLIFIASDIPHCVKKIVNAIKLSRNKSHKRDLSFQGKPLSLIMLYDVSKTETVDNISADSSSIKTNKFRLDHFFKNAHN